MTVDQAKGILLTYRPWAAANDPAYAEALALARADSELRRWFEAHCAAQEAIRSNFKSIAIPEGLKAQILSERVSWLAAFRQRHRVALSVAALILIGIAAASLWTNLRPAGGPTEAINLAGFRGRMVTTAVRLYNMELETDNAERIREHLGRKGAFNDYRLTSGLRQTTLTGCGVLEWQGRKVSMVCFRSGKSLPAGMKSDLYLFVADRSTIPDAPTGNRLQVEQVNRLTTASWTVGEKVYVLAAEGDETFLRRFL